MFSFLMQQAHIPNTGVNEASNPLEPGQNSYFSDCINNGSQMVPMMTKKKPRESHHEKHVF